MTYMQEFQTWADVASTLPRSHTINRDAGEGPPRCCTVALVAADHLVWFGGLPADVLATLRAAFPRWQTIPDADLYACDGCRELAWGLKYVTREAVARAHGTTPSLVAKAWLLDEHWHQRGPQSAPPEVTQQPWWGHYQALATTSPRGRFRSDVKELLKDWNPHVPVVATPTTPSTDAPTVSDPVVTDPTSTPDTSTPDATATPDTPTA